MSNPPSASTSLYFDHSHLISCTSNPSSLKKPFSTAQKIGASQVMPIYPTRIFVRFSPPVGDAALLVLQPTTNRLALKTAASEALGKGIVCKYCTHEIGKRSRKRGRSLQAAHQELHYAAGQRPDSAPKIGG